MEYARVCVSLSSDMTRLVVYACILCVLCFKKLSRDSNAKNKNKPEQSFNTIN